MSDEVLPGSSASVRYLLVSYLCGDSTQKSGNDKVVLVENSGSW